MPKRERNQVTKEQLAEMRKWRAEFSQSVRQVTARNKSTKDNPGTVLINCYTAKPSQPCPVNFLRLETTAVQVQQSLENYVLNPLLLRKLICSQAWLPANSPASSTVLSWPMYSRC